MIEQKLGQQPNDLTLLVLKARTLHFLGEQAEAEKAYRLARQISSRQEPREAVLAPLAVPMPSP